MKVGAKSSYCSNKINVHETICWDHSFTFYKHFKNRSTLCDVGSSKIFERVFLIIN